MTAKELAASLNGRDYDMRFSREEREAAKDSGLVVVYGFSDDLLEFDGAIEDELGAWYDTTAYVKNGMPLKEPTCEHWQREGCEYYNQCKSSYKPITAKWSDRVGPAWTIETEIPHEKFEIMEDGEVFSVGIVFDIKDTYDENR